MIRALTWMIFLTLIYALVLSSFSPWDLVLGLLISATVLWLFRDFLFDSKTERLSGSPRHWLAVVPFFIAVLKDVTLGIWTVALIVLGRRPLARSGIVGIPIGGRTAQGVAISALVMTLSPGSVLVDIDWSREIMWFHFIDASDPEKLRQTYQDLYHRYQRPVFP